VREWEVKDKEPHYPFQVAPCYLFYYFCNELLGLRVVHRGERVHKTTTVVQQYNTSTWL
jgi:hypothetical protein